MESSESLSVGRNSSVASVQMSTHEFVYCTHRLLNLSMKGWPANFSRFLKKNIRAAARREKERVLTERWLWSWTVREWLPHNTEHAEDLGEVVMTLLFILLFSASVERISISLLRVL